MTYQSTSRVSTRLGCGLMGLLLLAITADASATVIRYKTSLGDVDVRLFDTATPASVTNLLNYVNTDRYDGTFIHRSIPGFIVQGGGFSLTTTIFPATSVTTDAPVVNEFGISNLRGTVAYAKLGSDPNSATSQWFFNLANNAANLDNQNGGFTVFGRVLGDGMNVVDAIAALPRVNANGAFTDLPVTDLAQVTSQQDVTSDEAVMINDVEVLTNPDGDYNFDGTVDGADYTIWRDTLGSTTLVEADGNGNGVVDAADYIVWQNGFGSSSSTATTVPEPTTLGLLLLGVTCITRRQRADR